MVKYFIISVLAAFILNASETPDYPYSLGDKRQVTQSWSNSGYVTIVGEILTIATINQSGGVRFQREDGTSIWANQAQASTRTKSYSETFQFSQADVGLSVYILNNQPNQNLSAGNTYTIIFVNSSNTSIQLSNGAWLSAQARNINWRFLNEEDVTFRFTNAMVGGLITMVSGGSYHSIINVVNEGMAETHDGLIIYSNGFPTSWRVISFFNPDTLPSVVNLIPQGSNSATQNLPEVWEQVQTGINNQNLPIYRPAGDQYLSTFALLYKEMDDLSNSSTIMGASVTNHNWYMLVPQNSIQYPVGHPLANSSVIYKRIVPNGITGGGGVTGQYLIDRFRLNGVWTEPIGSDYAIVEGFELTTQSQDFPGSNPEITDGENDRFLGYLVERNYLVSSPKLYDYFDYIDEGGTTLGFFSEWSMNSVPYLLQTDSFYNQMATFWKAYNDDWHILNLEITYNIKSANDPDFNTPNVYGEVSVKDYYWISPVKFRISGGLFNTGVLEDGNYLYEISGFTIIPVENYGSRQMSPDVRRMRIGGSYNKTAFNLSKSQFYRTGSGLLSAQNNTMLASMTSTNQEGKKVYTADHQQWYMVKTNYRVHNKLTGLQTLSETYSVFQYAYINDSFSILN